MNTAVKKTGSRLGMPLYAVLAIFVQCAGCAAATESNPAPDVVKKLTEAFVEVLVDGRINGSGAFVSPDGDVLTAAHIILSPQSKLEVLSKTAGRVPAKLIAVDKGHDIALIRVENQNERAFLPVSQKNPHVGQRIFVMGSPINRHGLLLQGIIASGQPSYEYLNEQSTYLHVWYVAAMIPRGASGGTWVNASGQIVGVQSGWVNDDVANGKGGFNSGLSFMAGPDVIHDFLRTRQHADTPSPGGILEEMWTQSTGFQQRFEPGTEGIVIHKLTAAGPLEKAGLAHEDLIVTVDGKKLRYRRELMDIIRAKKPGDKLLLDYISPDNKGTGQKEVVLDSLERKWLSQSAEAHDSKSSEQPAF